MRQSTKAALVAATLVLGTATAAEAAGRAVAQARQVVFYYEGGSGDANSNEFTGGTTTRLRVDAPGCCANGGRGSVTGYLYQQRTLQPDPALQFRSVQYTDPEYVAGALSTSSSSRYYTKAVWGAVSTAQPGDPNGYSRAG